jgi:hypothetical protein
MDTPQVLENNMICLFRSLNAIAKGGDGLRPELIRETSEAHGDDEATARKTDGCARASEELAKRRKLANAQAERETRRRAYLRNLLQTRHDIEELRTWIESQEDPQGNPEFARMMVWACEELAAMSGRIEPAEVTTELRERNLFPAIDNLADFPGEQSPFPRPCNLTY